MNKSKLSALVLAVAMMIGVPIAWAAMTVQPVVLDLRMAGKNTARKPSRGVARNAQSVRSIGRDRAAI